ncbi:MAG TPA: hypothetical protein DCZ69_06705 [Syntrophobacteraceae bacterium]|nr:hypothetical protein [Syntrophobacteraceae bacterium]HBZ54615.1 hypothetical protein [Syntrophobacteraceae bacterium]
MSMATQLTVISCDKPDPDRKVLLPEGKFKHFQNILGVVLRDAQDTWADLWEELQDQVTDGVMVLPSAEEGFRPQCGWPEFLEKMWLLKHYIDHARRFSEGK